MKKEEDKEGHSGEEEKGGEGGGGGGGGEEEEEEEEEACGSVHVFRLLWKNLCRWKTYTHVLGIVPLALLST